MVQDKPFDQEVIDKTKRSAMHGGDYQVVAKFRSHETALKFCRTEERYKLRAE